ncbi:MAG: hypothetical protein QF785_01950 [Phycisphaeraceae bacterium]|jgi:hypothetical protein|nr:hypothetical protein [Phycisphaeraceae bacterium]MDP7347722.1 hypothetical protein [Phycisphaeraceae bacterium]
MREWIWRHFRFELPDDWEMLQYSRRLDAGRCAMADRYQYRLEFNWKEFDTAPDFDRTLSDYRHDLERAGDAKATSEHVAGWRGLRVDGPDALTTRFGRYFKEVKCLLEVVLIWPDKVDADLTRSILERAGVAPVANGVSTWRAFGMTMQPASDLKLQRCEVEPARAMLDFRRDRDSPLGETFERLGMVDHWLKGDVGQWLTARTPRQVRDAQHGTHHRDGHQVHEFAGRYIDGRLKRLLARSPDYASAAWRCPHDGRLYAMTRIGRKRPSSNTQAHDHTPLACCLAMEHRK